MTFIDIRQTLDKHGGVFSSAATLVQVLHSFRESAVAWAASIRGHYVARAHTKLEKHVAESERARYMCIISVVGARCTLHAVNSLRDSREPSGDCGTADALNPFPFLPLASHSLPPTRGHP